VNRDTRERFVLPVLVPIVILVFFVGGAYALAQLMMFLPSSLIALVVVLVLTAVVIGGIAVTASRGGLSTTATVGGTAGVLVLVLAVGTISAIAGPREGLAELMEAAASEETYFVAVDIDYAERPETIVPGQHEFTLENQGRTRHSVTIRELGDEQVVLARPGDTETGTVTLEAGEYYFYCDVADHEDRGMFGTLEVAD
jgi:plastocyanin